MSAVFTAVLQEPRKNLSILLSGFFICAVPMVRAATPWLGIVDPSRAVDWSQAGVPGGIPSANWAQCGSIIAAGATSATINTAIQNCAANHYVLLGPGTFNLGTGIVMKSNVVLRGSGADQTFLVFTGGNGCNGGYGANVDVCIASGQDPIKGTNWSGAPNNTANWTSGYAKGTTQITLDNVANLKVGWPLMLDQNDDAADTGNFFACQSNTITPPCSLEGNGGATRPNRDQSQIVTVTAINGNTVTISPAIDLPNFRASQSPGAWWATFPQFSIGIENMSLDHTKSLGNKGIFVSDCVGCWVSGIRSIDSGKAHVEMAQSNHTTVQNSYFYLTQNSVSQSYGIEALNSADDLYVNNIHQYVTSPLMINGPCTGCVVAYNFSVNDYYEGSAGWSMFATNQHTAGTAMMLYEGNIGSGLTGDNFHGTHNMITSFRNYWIGNQPSCFNGTPNQFAPCNNNLNPIGLQAYSRYYNIIGNVLGQAGTQNGYQNTSQPIYVVGLGDTENTVTVPNDPLVGTTLMRWGNYDVITAGIKWDPAEVPSGIGLYANALPASQTLPASFYLTSQPGWWPAGKPWPPIGPDVTGGNVAGMGGHANTLPAQDCYSNVMHGPASGTGAVLSFNATTCYGASAPPPPPPATSPCDINSDGTANVADVQLEVNMALGISSCTNSSGTCTVVSVQRVVNAALGGTCVAP